MSGTSGEGASGRGDAAGLLPVAEDRVGERLARGRLAPLLPVRVGRRGDDLGLLGEATEVDWGLEGGGRRGGWVRRGVRGEGAGVVGLGGRRGVGGEGDGVVLLGVH